MASDNLKFGLLGQTTEYPSHYTPELLHCLPRQQQRKKLGIDTSSLPFTGVDIWNAYELSWLNPKGKPQVGTAEFYIPCASKNMVESKSFKLYLNSLNQTQFIDQQDVKKTLEKDLSERLCSPLKIKLNSLSKTPNIKQNILTAKCLDDVDITTQCYTPTPELLTVDNRKPVHQESLTSHLFKTNCPVTGQPDWASIYIDYHGQPIDHDGLLNYLISYRQHCDFHEHCVESIFMDIWQICKPTQLTVYARYTRRGGLDINPWRSNHLEHMENIRLCRQ